MEIISSECLKYNGGYYKINSEYELIKYNNINSMEDIYDNLKSVFDFTFPIENGFICERINKETLKIHKSGYSYAYDEKESIASTDHYLIVPINIYSLLEFKSIEFFEKIDKFIVTLTKIATPSEFEIKLMKCFKIEIFKTSVSYFSINLDNINSCFKIEEDKLIVIYENLRLKLKVIEMLYPTLIKNVILRNYNLFNKTNFTSLNFESTF